MTTAAKAMLLTAFLGNSEYSYINTSTNACLTSASSLSASITDLVFINSSFINKLISYMNPSNDSVESWRIETDLIAAYKLCSQC